MEILQYSDLNNVTCTAKYMSSHYFEFYNYLMTNYPEDLTFSERLYWYYNNITEKPVCKACGKKVSFFSYRRGYATYCSSKCAHSDEEVKEKAKQTCIEKYGVKCPTQSKEIQEKIKQTCLEKYGATHALKTKASMDKQRATCMKKYGTPSVFQSKECQEKAKQTCIEKYGVENYSMLPECREKVKQTCLEKFGVENTFQSKECQEKAKQTCLEKYGVENYSMHKDYSKKVKKTNLEKYGVEACAQSEVFREKAYQTKKKNHSFNTSSIEQKFKAWLDENNIIYKYQYRSELYPFACDFYFPKRDLYFEINGMWVHGGHPYDSNSIEDCKQLAFWESQQEEKEFYKTAIHTWTISDPHKVQVAKNNNLNFCSVYSNKLSTVIEAYNNA